MSLTTLFRPAPAAEPDRSDAERDRSEAAAPRSAGRAARPGRPPARLAEVGDRLLGRIDGWLTPRRVQGYSLIVLIVMLVGLSLSTFGGRPPFNAMGQLIVPDYAGHVTGARIVLDGRAHELYDLARQSAAQEAVIGAPLPGSLDLFISPSFVAFVWAPFAALPFLVGAALWSAMSLGLLLLSIRLIWPIVPRLHAYGAGAVTVVLLSTAPVAENLGAGQDASISLLLLAAGLRLLQARRDTVAGLVLGLGVFKPQLFVLFPVMFLFQRRWRALGAWIAMASGLAVASLAIDGTDGLRAYAALLTSDYYQVGLAGALGWKMQSASAALRSLLPSIGGAYISALGLAAGAAVVAVAAHKHRRRSGPGAVALAYALTVLVTALVNPHFFIYDCVLLWLPALVLLNEVPGRRAVRLSLAAAYALTLTASPRHVALGEAAWPISLIGAQWTMLPLFVLLWVTLRAMRQDEPDAVVPERQRDPDERSGPGDEIVDSPAIRKSIAAACPPNPSAFASAAAGGPSRSTSARPSANTLVIFTKSCTVSGDEKRAVPPVGMTWLGPAV
jgi:hypothetical protein